MIRCCGQSLFAICDLLTSAKMSLVEVQLISEDERAKKGRIRSIRITQGLGFVFALGFSSVITGIYPYLKEVKITPFEGVIFIKYSQL